MKNNRNKVLSLSRVLVITIMLSLMIFTTGCQGKDIKVSAENSDSKSDKPIITIPVKSVPVPEGGWTVEELAKTIHFNGVPIELPFTINSLGEDYQFNDEYAIWGIDNSTPKPTATLGLMHKGIEFGIFYLTGVESKDLDSAKSLDVVRFATFTDFVGQDKEQLININGMTLGSTATDVIEGLGEPDDFGGMSYIYFNRGTKDKLIAVQIDEDNIVCGIYVNLINE